MRSVLSVFAAGLLLSLLPALARSEGAITGESFAEVKRAPEVLRIHVELLAKDKTLKEALAKLKVRRAAAEKQLYGWGVTADSVYFGDPALSSDKTDRQQQMERMVSERMRRKGGKKTTPEVPPTIVGMTITGDIPLKSKTTEDLLLEFQDLKEKIQTADLSGIKELQKLSPQEEELAEEMSGRDMYDGGEPRRGEPTLLLIARVPEEERTKALAEAYRKARVEATQLARAAGVELGALNTVRQSAFGATDEESSYRAMRYRMASMPGIPDLVKPGEASAMQPGKVVYRVAIQASFNTK
jgi:uncharacterized protein YggE